MEDAQLQPFLDWAADTSSAKAQGFNPSTSEPEPASPQASRTGVDPSAEIVALYRDFSGAPKDVSVWVRSPRREPRSFRVADPAAR